MRLCYNQHPHCSCNHDSRYSCLPSKTWSALLASKVIEVDIGLAGSRAMG